MTRREPPLGRLLRDLAACDASDGPFATERADMLRLADWLESIAGTRARPEVYATSAARLRKMAADLEGP